MSDSYCAPMMYRGKKIAGGAARNVRIKNGGGLENMINVAAKQTAIFMAQQFMGSSKNQNKKANN